MVVLRKKNCNDCQKIFEITFLNQDYIEKLNNKYISVILTYENKNDYPVEMFYTLDFPALFFINSDDESFLIDPIFGYVSPEQLKIKLSLSSIF